MRKIRIPLLLLSAIVVMLVFFNDRNNFRYRYQVGSPWNYETLVAPFDFPVLKSEDQLQQEREQKSAQQMDCYRYDGNVIDQVLQAFEDFGGDTLRDVVSHSLRRIYRAGVVSSLNGDGPMISVRRGKHLEQMPASDVFTTADACARLQKDLSAAAADMNVDSLLASNNLSEVIVPNMYYDARTTANLARQALDYISPTSGMVYSGQTIVSRGEVVTNETARKLDSYKAEFISAYGGNTHSDFMQSLSHLFVVLLLLAIYLLMMYTVDKSLFFDFKKLAFLMLLYILVYIGISVFPASNETILYLIPFALYVLFVREFFPNRICLPLYLAALLPLLALRDNGVELYLMNALAGAVLLISYKYFNRGFRQFANSVFIFIALMCVYGTFRLLTGTVLDQKVILFLALNAILAILGFPFVYLFERIFSLPSQMRLWDLADTNNPLLVELSRKAPGSFQHALAVANLAEAASRAVGANTRLARVGALYHDIGKIENPLCFTENQTAEQNYHQHLTPEQSARDIIRHVDDGLALARKNNLPEQVVDIIASHHGTTKTMYFYTKYCNAGGDPSNTEPFTYKGKLPVDKEAVILMFADSVEAASRSLRDYSPESISEMVNRIIDGKIAEGQVAKGDITMAEIDTVKQVFIENLQQMYHGRVAYPKPVKKD
ncbi:MAG: HDIG domain-containing protein [Bacteroidales bacterium]|nr:HDIG domain-containing protein [Bacteroidales bacterium]